MSSLDSRAAFKARALELNLPEDLITKLAAINVDTFGALAFIGPLQAGTTDEGPLISMLKRALGSAPDDGVLSIARRLWFESTTQALAEMRGKVERTDASEPQRMPLAERTQRIAALQKRLVGIHWTVDIEPSHKLQDSVAQMVTDQSLVWIPWDRLTSRSLEITAEKLDPSVSFDSSGNLKLIKRSADPSCNTTGEYAVKLALQRRSLAFELGRICRYEYLEAWHDQLLQIHMRQQLAGHQRVSLNQLREADKMLWTRIAEDTRGALSIRPDGTYPFEASLAKWKDHTQVQCYLMPLLRSAPAPTLVPQPPADKGNGKGRHQKQTGKDIKKDNPNAEKPSSADGDKKKTWTVPAGCHSRDNDGKPLCFSFNLKGCNFCKPGKRCRRGRHLCWNVVTPFFKDDETGGERLAAEELARELLQGETISSGDLVRLSMALPSEVPSRGRNSGGRSVSLGAFAFSGSQRLLVRDASRQYPLSTRVFARFLRQLSKDFTCTTIAVFTNLRTALHQDTANDPNSRNLLYPLTAFSGGGVWVESPDGVTTYMHDGKARTGHVLPVSEGLCFLDAPNPQHVTLEWQGERSLLVGYSATGAADMPADTRAYLEDRLRLYNKLNQMEKELRYEEARLHSTLPDHAREVVKGKNLLLWAKLLEETSFPDKGVFELMKGVDLVGKPDKSPLFETKEVPAKSSEALLLESAKWRRERLKSRDPHKGDVEATQQLWECTLKDRDNGFLCGPFYDEESVKEHLGVDEFVCSRRFVIEQGTPEKLKLRPIDNYKEGGVNEAYHSLEKLALFDTDWMLAMATYIARVSDSASCIEIVLSTGETLRGELHPFWRERKPVWQGRTLDLEKAYRQVPLSTGSLKLGVVMVTNPESGRPVFFVAQSLPFGASSSVFAFNRLSRSILHLSWTLVGMISGCFYDDFPLLEKDTSAKLTTESFEHLLRRIGWKYSCDPDKYKGFEDTFDPLGIRLTAKDIADGVVTLQNKASRLDKMKDAFIRFGLSGQWNLREVQSLQGQVNFALGFASGRALKMLQRALGSFIREPEVRTAADLRALCEFGIKLLENCKPQVFGCRGPERPVLIFTDAAYEKGVASYGVVLVDPFTSSRLVGGGKIAPALVDFWKLDSPDQVIGQAEAFAVVLARRALSRFITGRRVLYFIDNEGAREVLIKGSSKSRTLLLLGSIFFEMENKDQSLTWLERVPSASNIADAPSRGEIHETAARINGTVATFDVTIYTDSEYAMLQVTLVSSVMNWLILLPRKVHERQTEAFHAIFLDWAKAFDSEVLLDRFSRQLVVLLRLEFLPLLLQAQADEKAAETARIAAETALKAKTVNRAEKYLPNLPVIDHQGMSKGRMREVECWHSFLETLSSWLALQDEAYVRELQFCVKTKHEIEQASLAADVAARSAKLFYYLTQSLAKWERGLELLRSCSKRQSQSATGYEVECKNIRQPTDVIRHLEDEFSRAESKLTNFAELKLSEADKCSVLLQALGPQIRQYVLLHGSSSDWKALTKSLTYYEEQLRLCEVPSSNRALNTDLLCDYCGKRGHLKKDCWKWKREQKIGETPKDKGKGDKGPGKGKDTPKGKGDQPKGPPDPKGKGKGKDQKGKPHKKKSRKVKESTVQWTERRASLSLKLDRPREVSRSWPCGSALGPFRDLIER
ncbi:hypothetical protein AK812_SmicGene44377 [Symbiodinium microadriaticum]|uniref:CCHC-type domain-containing protein n=1 Tax=Symbiodinium microadriaticum TaxID=2951 RepID=A0A1Q9BYN1_SYMMI|nr:hypothetical protein AK812_SmicGene44377 [Symbiodinium microadriaticum]